ncbi:MAG: hypothetical protein IJ362_09455 [Oscillospiraceae bacterium]|nr:hypothetical protein [Oscillospiraceae bacterium]
MIKLITGPKGSGKTKEMIDMINENLSKVKGNIVCIEKAMQATHNVNAAVRLIDVDEYKIADYETFYGFFAGVLAGNYDIEQVYVDGLLKIGKNDIEGLGALLEKMDAIASDKLVVVTVSAAVEDLTENVKKYL